MTCEAVFMSEEATQYAKWKAHSQMLFVLLGMLQEEELLRLERRASKRGQAELAGVFRAELLMRKKAGGSRL